MIQLNPIAKVITLTLILGLSGCESTPIVEKPDISASDFPPPSYSENKLLNLPKAARDVLPVQAVREIENNNNIRVGAKPYGGFIYTNKIVDTTIKKDCKLINGSLMQCLHTISVSDNKTNILIGNVNQQFLELRGLNGFLRLASFNFKDAQNDTSLLANLVTFNNTVKIEKFPDNFYFKNNSSYLRSTETISKAEISRFLNNNSAEVNKTRELDVTIKNYKTMLSEPILDTESNRGSYYQYNTGFTLIQCARDFNPSPDYKDFLNRLDQVNNENLIIKCIGGDFGARNYLYNKKRSIAVDVTYPNRNTELIFYD